MNMRCSTTSTVLAVLALAGGVAGCTVAIPLATAGVSRLGDTPECDLSGKLGALLDAPNHCARDLDTCPLARALATGGGREFIDLFGELLHLSDREREKVRLDRHSQPPYAASCRLEHGTSPSYLDNLAIQGIGYAGATQYAPTLAAIVEAGYYPSLDTVRAELLVQALWRAGDPGRTGPALVRVLTDSRKEETRALALQYLTRWRTPAAKPFCMDRLADTTHRDVYVGCLAYLAAVGAKEALPLMERNMEHFGEETVRAMGLLGDASAVPALERYLDRHDGGAMQRAPALVALINLGKESYYTELTESLRGLRAVRTSERAQMTEAKRAARDTLADEHIAQGAAMESVLLHNPAVTATLDTALREIAMAPQVGNKWRPRTYAAIALAQRGDPAGIDLVAAELNGSDEAPRNAILNAIGGGANWLFHERGLGVVADPKVAAAVIKYLDSEGNQDRRVEAVHALVEIHAAARNLPAIAQPAR
jgi:hypothetical protein